MGEIPLAWASFDGAILSMCPLGPTGGWALQFMAGHVEFDHDLEELNYTLPPIPPDVTLPPGVVHSIRIYPTANPNVKDKLQAYMQGGAEELPDFGFRYKFKEPN